MQKLKYFFLFSVFFSVNLFSQNAVKDSIKSLLARYEYQQRSVLHYRLNDLKIDDKRRQINLTFSENFAKIPFTEQFIDSLKKNIKTYLPNNQRYYEINIFANKVNIENLVPNLYRNRIVKDKSRFSKTNKDGKFFVQNIDRPFKIREGLNGRNIALWNSHGWYYEQKYDRWEWQRARILTTVEDKFTTQIVMNFLLPMLENAGANVFLPRERDIQDKMIICDEDGNWNNLQKQNSYAQIGNSARFSAARQIGFADKKEFYTDGENPFTMGTCRLVETDRNGDAWVEYTPKFDKSGWYSVYVCYRSVANGVEDAHYKVYHSGGETEFVVNQTMGSGTWIYLGTFYFDYKDDENHRKVVLSNQSRKAKHYVVADAVRFGGGMGNIARKPATQATIDAISDENRRKKSKLLSTFVKDTVQTSHRARFWEGARYYLQWAGMPFEIYSHTLGINDYIDDYAARGKWVNYLNYGSENAPDSIGLKIPVDVSLAFHSDAGIDTIGVVGTLGIVTKQNGNKSTFPNTQSRYSSVDMANIILNQIKNDIGKTFDKNWTIRGINNASYAESRMPSVPSMILESMSHQNLNDLRYGLNPNFQFTYARAVYKGILKFLATQNGKKYEIQPLPVQNFSAILDKNENKVHLKWSPTTDTIEPTAKPTGYVVYTRKHFRDFDGGGRSFDNGIFVKDTFLTLFVGNDTVFSYKITAVNKGGESFPSEILSVCKKSNSKGEILIINGFTKTSAPQNINECGIKGFPSWKDRAIPYMVDYSYTGEQYDFNINNEWTDDDSPGFGASYGIDEQTAVAGNNFDYPYFHGFAIQNAGYSFSSCSVLAAENGDVSINNFKIVDLILGKQKRAVNDFTKNIEFQTFTPKLQQKITEFLHNGNSLLVSGAYIGKDLCEQENKTDKNFAENVLKFNWRTDKAAKDFNAIGVYSPVLDIRRLNLNLVSSQINSNIYAVESPDAIEPADKNAYTIMRYLENSMSAATAYKGTYKVVVFGFPLETIASDKCRNELIKAILDFFE